MIPQLIIGACITAGAVLRRRRLRRLNRRSPNTRSAIVEIIDSSQTSFQRDLQQLFEIASSHPRLLLNNRVRNRIQRVSRRISQADEPMPWQLAFIYRQMDVAVDSLSYDELYELFGGNPTPPAITKDEARCLESWVFDSMDKNADGEEEEEDIRSDEVMCPICLELYESGDKLTVLPSCKHVFHAKCIFQWLKLRGDCPICRQGVKEEITAANRRKNMIETQ